MTVDYTKAGTGAANSLPPLPARHVGRWIGSAIVLAVVAMLIESIATNENFKWGVVFGYLFHPTILAGFRTTVVLTASVMGMAVVLGVILAVMRTSRVSALRYFAMVYIWLFRGVPALVQILIWFNMASLYRTFSLGIPFGPSFVTYNANDLISPWTAALLGLALCEAAYMAEIVRAGILSVDQGQTDASKALGMPSHTMLRRIILPQALRIIIPPTGNETIGMLKYTSIASIISVSELLRSAELIYSRTFEVIPLLLTASIWYLVCTTLLTIVQGFIEKFFSRGYASRSQSEAVVK